MIPKRSARTVKLSAFLETSASEATDVQVRKMAFKELRLKQRRERRMKKLKLDNELRDMSTEPDAPPASVEIQGHGEVARIVISSKPFGLQLHPKTLRIATVVPGGAAERAGVQIGWKLVAINDKKVNAKS